MPPSRTALVSALLGVLLVVLSGCSDDAPPGWRAYETRAVAPPGIAEACPDPAAPLPYPGGGELPSGAVAVRLCNGPEPTGDADEDGSGLLFAPPADLLETQVEDLVEIVNGLEPLEAGGQECDGDLGPTSVYWFLYEDGDARAVRLQHDGCDRTFVAPDQAGAGGEVLVDTFDHHLREQRATRTPPGDARVPSCDRNEQTPVSPLSLTEADLQLAAAVYCTAQGRAVLSPGQRRLLSEDLRTPPSPSPVCEEVSGQASGQASGQGDGESTIAGRTVWGDVLLLHGRCSSYPAPFGLVTPDDESPWLVLSPAVRRMLTSLPLRPVR